jgi:preprotein translocase subunit YajC
VAKLLVVVVVVAAVICFFFLNRSQTQENQKRNKLFLYLNLGKIKKNSLYFICVNLAGKIVTKE